MENIERLAKKYGLDIVDIKTLLAKTDRANEVISGLEKCYHNAYSLARVEDRGVFEIRYGECSFNFTREDRESFDLYEFTNWETVSSIIKKGQQLVTAYEKELFHYFESKYGFKLYEIEGVVDRMQETRGMFGNVGTFDNLHYAKMFIFRFDFEAIMDFVVDKHFNEFGGFKNLYDKTFTEGTRKRFYDWEGEPNFLINNSNILSVNRAFSIFKDSYFGYRFEIGFIDNILKMLSYWFNWGESVEMLDTALIDKHKLTTIDGCSEWKFVEMSEVIESVKFYKNGRADFKFNGLKNKVEFMEFYGIKNGNLKDIEADERKKGGE